MLCRTILSSVPSSSVMTLSAMCALAGLCVVVEFDIFQLGPADHVLLLGDRQRIPRGDIVDDTSVRARSTSRRTPDPRRQSVALKPPARRPGFSVPSTNPSRSRLSKNRKPCTSSTTVTAPAIDLRMWSANSKQTSIVSARMWNNRSPGVAGAACRGPSSSTNGCSSAGRGPSNSRSQAREPIEVTTDKCLGRVTESDCPHQPGNVGQRVVHDALRRPRQWWPPGRSRPTSAARAPVAA